MTQLSTSPVVLYAEIEERLDRILRRAPRPQAILAQKLMLASLAVAIHGTDEVGQELAKRVDDWLADRKRPIPARRRGVWVFVTEYRQSPPVRRRGEDAWSAAAKKFKISAATAKADFYAEDKARRAQPTSV